ncbi:MAG: hypothetical protein V8R51_06245 [Clostridia bacterium]
MKEKSKNIKILIITIIIILLSISGITYYKYNNGVVLTLLHDNSPRQMMGFVMQTKNKTIVIDGGLKEDSENLQNKIKECGKQSRCVVFNTSTYGSCTSIFGYCRKYRHSNR